MPEARWLIYIYIYIYIYIGGWGSEFVRTPQPGNRFRFRVVRACVRAGGRAGDQGVDVRSDFREKSDPPSTFPFSLFGTGGLPFSLVWISMILRLPEGLEVKYR